MKKFWKFEKQPKKNVLLHTYLTSLMCMVLCVSMFIGTSYAWFTSEVTSKGNEIYIGTLKVGLYKQDGTDLSQGGELFDGDIRWEPGYTAIETVQIRNEGELAFLYELSFLNDSDNGLSGTALRDVAKNFAVYIHPGNYGEGEQRPNAFADIEADAQREDGKWRPVRMGQKIATLADILEYELPVLSDSMVNVQGTEDTYIIALHMKEDAEGQTLMGKKISLNVKLTAYQRAYEKDAFDATYDITPLRARVVELGQLVVDSSTWINEPTEQLTLDAAYQFLPVESSEEGKRSPYKDYIADFAVWADREVKANTMALAGYYELFCSLNKDRWIALKSDVDITATKEEPIRLVKGLYPVTYELLCDYGNDGIGFLCGVANLAEENVGTTITVELRLYEVDENGQETGEFVVAGTKEYTFQ